MDSPKPFLNQQFQPLTHMLLAPKLCHHHDLLDPSAFSELPLAEVSCGISPSFYFCVLLSSLLGEVQ